MPLLRSVALAVAVLLAQPLASLAAYPPDVAASVDLTLRGDALIPPAALIRDVGGTGFVTIGRSESGVVICAFTTAATLDARFGTNGCARESIASTENPYQLLAGRS